MYRKLPEMADGTNDERTPRWVKIFGAVALVGVVLVVVLLLTGRGGGGHGPGRHGAGALAVHVSS